MEFDEFKLKEFEEFKEFKTYVLSTLHSQLTLNSTLSTLN